MTPGSFTVAPGAAHQRLDVYLAAELKAPRSQIQRLVATGQIHVNDRTERASYLLRVGDKVKLMPDSTPPVATSAPPDLPIVYEDADLMVVDKPAGLMVHHGAGKNTAATVADWARSRTTDPNPDRPGIVHRLDRDTSGLLIIAKTPVAKTYLQTAFKQHQIHKTYQLLVIGRPSHDQALVQLPLGRSRRQPLRQAVVPGGRASTTQYRVLSAYPGYTLIEAEPATGRTHQLRVHFATLGHPVAGDITYGPARRPLRLQRQFLHAAELRFTAPSGAQLHITSPLPADLQAALGQLEAAANPIGGATT